VPLSWLVGTPPALLGPDAATVADQAGASVGAAAVPSAFSSGWVRVLASSCPYDRQSPPVVGPAQVAEAACAAGTMAANAAAATTATVLTALNSRRLARTYCSLDPEKLVFWIFRCATAAFLPFVISCLWR
jgi:hypothetical protein